MTQGWKVPVAARTELDAALRVLAAHFQVASDAEAGHEVEANPLLRAELTPQGSGLTMVLLAAPFGDFGPRLPPGGGRLRVTTVHQGVTLSTKRDLTREREAVNKLLSVSADMLGISGFRWRTKHNVWHHTYTNIAGFDDDIATYGAMRLTPREPWRPLFRLQAWYFPLIYSMIGFDFIIRDFMMVLVGKSDANHVYPKMTPSDKIAFWLGKLFFFTVMFALPLQVFPWWQVLIGFFIVMMTVGLVLGIVFQLAHILEIVNFPEPVGAPPHMENEWAIHQVQTTANFAPGNKLLNFYVGGLNYQVEHHLLPHVCHLNYPRVAPIVRQTCEEFGIRYNSYSTWRGAFVSHWRELRKLGRQSDSEVRLGGVPAK